MTRPPEFTAQKTAASRPPGGLPAPTGAQLEQLARSSAALQVLVHAHGGWLPFDDYLQQLLYAPGLGYYSAGAAKFGAAGDFVTAPEISPLFGHCIARQCAPLLGAGAALLELGAGSGALAETLLRKLDELQALPQHYYILEVSADLRERQRARLATLPEDLQRRVQWLDALPAQRLRGVVLANEVADALPFQCFAATDAGFVERGVGLGADRNFTWAERPAGAELARELERLAAGLRAGFAPGFQGELCTRIDPWIAALAAVLDEGLLLLFDYGLGRSELYHPQRSAGTLRCHYRHRAHDDPFLYPGLQDVTAWVDFTRVAEAASSVGLEVAGYCTQAAFLLASGIEQEFLEAPDGAQRARLSAQARELLMPGEMGETFKAMALTRGLTQPLAGFGLQDLRRLL